jgi:regulatory protein
MGREVPGEDSSFPSADLKLVRAERTGTGGQRIKLLLSDGSCFFVSEQDLRDQGLSPIELTANLELSDALIRRLKDSWARRQVRDKALDLLGRAPHTTVSLRLKLLKRGFDARIIGQILQSLSEQGHLDDRRFAESWLQSRAERRPEGRAALLAGLLRKGIGREIAEQAVNDYMSPAVEEEHALRALQKLKRLGETDRVRLMRKLRARGFPYPVIRRIVEEQPEP